MARANLGRKNLAARVPMAARLRLCPACGERKMPGAFQFRKKFRVLGIVCAECWRERPGEARRLLRVAMPLMKFHRRAIIEFLRARAQRRIEKGKEVKWMPEEYAVKVAKLPDRIAAIVGKTFAEMGDAATIADDEGLMKIRDLLLELDDTLIERNKNKRLLRR